VSKPNAAQAPPVEAVAGKLEAFLLAARKPAVLHPGDDPLFLEAGSYCLTVQPRGLLLEAWNEHRTLARRLVAVEGESAGRLIMRFEQFGGGTGLLEVVDLDAPRSMTAVLSARRHVLRERLRRWLARQYPGWRIEQLTDGADLEHTLSPVYSRALIRRGTARLAVLAAPQDAAHASRALTFGLIWLDYLRRRTGGPIEGLALFVPLREVALTRLRVRWMNTIIHLFGYDEDGHEAAVDCADDGNLIQALPPAGHAAVEPFLDRWARRALLMKEVSAGFRQGRLSLQYLGLEFAWCVDGKWWTGLDEPRVAASPDELLSAAGLISGFRSPAAHDRSHPWFRQRPEAWLEQLVRRDPVTIDATLLSSPVYGQIPEWAAADRGVLDLLAIDGSGRLAVLELKATEDPHLPVQALDYWIQTRFHAMTDGFTRAGYFAGMPILRLPPRLLLVAPALNFHPTTESVLAFFSPEVEVTRVGLAVEWQSELRVVLRAHGSARPDRQFG
jgi:hypothetical protein